MLDFDRFKVLTFDCYGTLIDWESGILSAVRPVMDAGGVHAGDDRILETYAEAEAELERGSYLRYEEVLRRVMASMCRSLGIDRDKCDPDCLVNSLGDWEPFPDTAPALKKLSARYKLAIISNIDDRLFEQTARHFEVPFEWVVTAEQVGSYKPAPRNFEVAMGRIGLPREQILHVAQSRYHDIVPARSLGLATVWVNRRRGKTGPGATPHAGGEPDLEVDSLESLTKIMGL